MSGVRKPTKPRRRASYVGPPATVHFLNCFGDVVMEAFSSVPYLVGSALVTKDWRDVDIRLILSDEEFADEIGELTDPCNLNERWNALCLAFSALGRQMTGLPIDFQIQQRTDANKKFDGPRNALFSPSRCSKIKGG